MLNSDLVFTVLTAAAAFGAAVVLAPSAARTDAPARIYAGDNPEFSDGRDQAAIFAKPEPLESVREISASEGDSELRAVARPTAARTGRKARRP